jgi:hypothetical protein
MGGQIGGRVGGRAGGQVGVCASVRASACIEAHKMRVDASQVPAMRESKRPRASSLFEDL